MTYGASHVLASALLFSLLNVIVGAALRADTHPLTLVTVRAVVVVALLAVVLKLWGVSVRLPARERNIALAIGLAACAQSLSITAALARLPVALTILVFYTYPVVACIVTWMGGSQRPDARSLAAIVLALAGIALALEVDFARYDTTGLMFALLSVASWTVLLFLSARYLRGADARPRVFWMQVTTLVVFTGATLLTGIVRFPATELGWWAVAATPLVYVVATILLLAATSNVGAMRASFYMNFEPIATVVLGVVLLREPLSAVQTVGAAMTIAALFLFRPLRPAPAAAPQGRA